MKKTFIAILLAKLLVLSLTTNVVASLPWHNEGEYIADLISSFDSEWIADHNYLNSEGTPGFRDLSGYAWGHLINDL